MSKIIQDIVSAVRTAALTQGRLRGRSQGREKLPFRRSLLVESLEQRVLLAADPLSVARVSGSVDSAGEIDHFSFHLDSAARVAFDSLTENSNLRWSLNGPAGAVVNNAYFRGFSSTDGNYAPLDLIAGDYRIDVQGQGDATGAYDMRLLDLARSAPISIDSAVTGNFDASAQTAAFTFDGQAGDNLFLTWQQQPGSYLRLYDPYGQLVGGNQFYYDGALPTLAYTGRYTALLDGTNGVTANAAYGFTLHRIASPVADQGLWSSPLLSLQAQIAGPGDSAVFTFTLDQSRSVVLDSLTWNDSLRLSITGPQGPVYDSLGNAVSGRGLGNYIDHAYYADGQLDLAAGRYSVILRGDGTTTGDVGLRLLDLAAATPITSNTVVSGHLAAGNQVQLYSLAATAGDVVSIRALSAGPDASNTPSLTLLDPLGRRVGNTWNFTDLNSLALNTTGLYTLVVSGQNNISAAEDFSFRLYADSAVVKTLTLGNSELRDPVWTAGPAPGETAVQFDGSNQLLSDPSAALDLTGDVTLEALVKLDSYGSNWTPIISRSSDWSHQTFGLWVGPQGQLNVDSNFLGNGWGSGSPAGAVALGQWQRLSATIDRVNGLATLYVNGLQVGQFGIDLRAATSLPAARLHVGNSDIVNSVNRGELHGAVADVRVWNMVRSATQILDNKDLTLAGNEPGLVLNLALDEGSGRSLADTSPNAIGVRNADLLEDLGPTLVEGAITQPGGRVVYNLSAATDRQILFDTLTADSRFSWSLIGPDGNPVVDQYGQLLSGRRLRDSDAYSRVHFNLRGGAAYQLVIDLDGDATGAFSFRLLDFASAQTIAYDTPVTSAPPVANATNLYAFDGVAGDQITLERLSYTDPRPVWRLYDPRGVEVVGTTDFYYGSGTTLTLTIDGRYTLALEGPVDAGGPTTQQFRVNHVGTTEVTPPAATALVFSNGEAALAGTLAGAYETQNFSFSLAQPTRIYVDTLNAQYPNYYTIWSLVGPSGVVGNRWSYDTDGVNHNSWYELSAGDYVFSVTQPWGWTGIPYAFKLIDIGQVNVVGFGNPINDTLNPANSTRFYAFDAQAGDHLFASVTAQSNMSNAYWRVFDESTGAVLGGSYFGTNLDGIVVRHDGRYLLSVEGYYGVTGTATFSINLDRNLDTPQPLVLGDVTAFSLPSGGGRVNYSFTLDRDTTVYFDPQSITPNYDSYWNLSGARGTEVGDSYLGWYYGFEGARTVTLKAGSYTLGLRSTQAVDHFNFRLVDVGATVAPLTLGADTAGTLVPGSGAAFYSFDAEAGQRVYFQTTSTSNGNLRWRVYDPFGRDITGNAGWSDWESTLGSSGRYTLIIEGFNNLGDSPINYRFRLGLPQDTRSSFDPAAVAVVTPHWVTDNAQAALQLDGTQDIQVAANPALNLASDVSFEVRMRIDAFDQTWQSVVYKGPNTTDYNSRSYTLWVNSAGYLYLTTSDNSGEMTVQTANGAVRTGQWYDVTGVIDRSSGVMKIYLDGVEAASGAIRTNNGNARMQDTPLFLGNAHEGWGNNNNQFQGAISEFRLWDQALSAAAVAAGLATPPLASDSHLKAWLRLDEASGSFLADASASQLTAVIHSRFEGLTGVVQGRISQAGQQDVHTLNLPQAGSFYLDSLTPYFSTAGSALNLRIAGPGIAFNENLTYFGNRVIQLPAGDYSFTVDGDGRGQGAYAFRLIDLAGARPITYDSAVSGDLRPGDTAALYQFDATAGDAVYFQTLGASGFNPAWRLIDPFGREVFGRSGMADRDTTTLAFTGRYTVIVDGDYSNYDQTSHFGFKLLNVTPTTLQNFDIATGIDAGVQRNTGADAGSVQVSATQYLEIPNSPASDQTGSYTLETRFRIDRWSANSWTPLLIKSTPTGTYQVGIFINNDGRIQVGAQPGTPGAGYNFIETAAGVVSALAWHDLAAVYDRANSQIRVVLDGVLVATGYLNPAAGVDLADALRVGYNNDGNDYSGGQVTVDQLAIWNRALSAAEAATAAAAPLVGNEAGLVALYRLDESSGATLTDALGGVSGSIVRFASLVGGLVTGRLTQPGQSLHYRFTLAQAETLYFDSLTRRSDIRWTLSGPSGSWGDALLYADANSGHSLMALAAGSYDITIDGDGAATGDFMFRLLDAGQAQTVALDQVVNDTISPGQVAKLYHFDGSAGQKVYFDMLSATPQAPVWRLIDPSGATVFGPEWMGDRDTLTLSRSGSYTLIVEGPGYWTSYQPTRHISFELRTVTDQSRTITLGTNQVRDPQWTTGPAAGEPAVKFDGSNQIVTDTGAALDLTGDLTLEVMVKVDGYANTWTPILSRCSDGSRETFGLYIGSSGQVDLNSNWQGNAWGLSSAAGVVQLGQWNRISATIDRTNGVARIYVNGIAVASAAVDTRAAYSLPDARTHVGSTDMANGDRGELYGAVSDVRIWNTVRSAAEIDAAQDQTQAGSEAGLVLNLQLDEGSGRSLADSSVSALTVRDADLYGDLGATLVEGAITQIGGRVVYSFTAAADAKLLFDSLTPDSRFTWSLLDASGNPVHDNFGQVLNGRSLRDSDAWSRVLFNVRAGNNYTLIVDGSGDATGNYAFRLLDFASATPIAYDTPTVWTTDQARSTALYAFDGAAGDQVVFDNLGYVQPYSVVHVYDPFGNEIYANNVYADSGPLALSATGRYTVALEGRIDDRGQQQLSFQIHLAGHVDVTPQERTPVNFVDGAATISGTLANVNEYQYFSFQLTEPKRIYIDSRNHYYTQGFYTIWNLKGPQGTLDNRWAFDTDGPNHFGWYDLPAGDYTFSVYTPYYPGTFSYTLLDVAQAQPLSYGQAVTATLDPANSSTFYVFDAQAGDRVFAAAGASSNMGNAYWRLVDPSSGAVLGGSSFGSPIDSIVLPHAGSYLLTVEGYLDTYGAASYGFTLFKGQDGDQALTLGALTTGSISQPGDSQRYHFTLDSATKLWFDSVGRIDGLVWRVLDKDGISVFGDRNYADFPWYYNTRVDLAAGAYTLVIDGAGAATGNFGFRLMDLAAATTITPGTAVAGQLAPADKTNLYRFDATAGDSFFFDVQSRSGGNPYWRLLDPYGNQVFAPEGLYDHATTRLTYSGTYTLAIEGYPDDPRYYAATVDYSFNVTPVLDQAPVPLAIGVLPGPNLQVNDLAVAGGDGSVHSGGSLLVTWTTANVGDRDTANAFQERVVVRNAAGETLVNQLVAYDAASNGAIAAGSSRSRSTTVQLPAGARGAGALTVSVFTDVTNAITEQGPSAETDNSSQLGVSSTLLTYPDLVVDGVVITPAANLAAGDQASVSWQVHNNGDKATNGTWADHVVVRNLSTGEVLIDQSTRVADADSALAAGASLARQLTFNWPAGRKAVGQFQVTVSTDALGEVAEYNAADSGERNNDATLQFSSAPDLQVSDLTVLNANPVSGDLLNLQWTVANHGNAPTPQGWFDRVQVINDSTGEYLVNVDVAYDPVTATGAALAAGGTAQRNFSVRLPDGARATGNLRVVVTVDQNGAGASLIPESNESNNDATVVQAVTLKPYPNLAVDSFSAAAAQRSGDAMALSWTVSNHGTLATTASSWYDRVILSADAVIGNGDDVVLGSILHSGALAAAGAYTVSTHFTVPANLDGNYHLAVVTDAFGADTEPDNRADNTSSLRDLLLTAYHADLVPRFTAVPAAATGGSTMTVSWHVDNNGDAATNGNWWYDQLWLTQHGVVDADAIALGVWGHSGALAVGQGYDISQQVGVPNGLSGSYQLVLRSDTYNYIFESRFRSNDSVASGSTVTITPAPAVDLRVSGVSGAAQAAPGEMVTVAWDVTNSGNAGSLAAQPWTDQVYVSRDGTLNGATYLGSLTHSASLSAGESYHASLGVTVPDLGDGNWRFVVLTDVANQVFESGAADAESANSAAAATATSLVHPDLRPADLAVGPLTGGQSAQLSWTVRNDGSGAVNGSWVERAYLSTDGTLDGSDVFLGQLTASGGLAPGASTALSLAITPPLGASGAYRILVLSDADNSVREVAGESNNGAALVVSVAAAPLPDLQVGAITAPANGLAGRTLTLGYAVSNSGRLDASGGWTEQVFLSNDNAIGGDILLGSFYEATNSIAAGSSTVRSREVTLPAYATAGDWHLVVRVDAGNAQVEQDELNNAAIASTALTLGNALALSLNTAAVSEAAGAAAVTGTLQRSGNTTAAVTVLLGSSLAGLSLPASVLIPAGQASATFLVGVVDNAVVDGNRDGSLTASAAGYADSSVPLRIVDNDVPQLTLSTAATTVGEGAGALTVTLTRNTLALDALTVALTNSKPGKMTVPGTLSFAAGQASISFTVTPVDDTAAEGDRNVDLTATAAGHVSAGLRFLIQDNDIPALTLDLSTAVVSEGDGAIAAHGSITRSIVSNNALTVLLTGVAGQLTVPTFVTFAAGQATVDFNVGVVDNALVDGNRSATITVAVPDQFSGSALPGTRVAKSLLITDNDGPTLTLSINNNMLAESAGAGAAVATVTRNTPTTADLVVTLSSTDTTEATAQQTVTILAGQASATFAVDAVQDNIQDGTQNATLIASASGFNSGSVALQVTDRDLADLQVTKIETLATAITGQTVTMTWTDLNAGLGDATGGWQDLLYLSADSALSGDDQLVGTFQNSGPLPPQTTFVHSVDVKLGSRVGDMYVFVVTDSGRAVTELNEANNVQVAKVTVTPSYYATVSTETTVALAGTPVQLTGTVYAAQASTAAAGTDIAASGDAPAPKPFVLIRIKVITAGTTRTIDAVADRNGNFHATFTPLPGEAGHYSVAAVYPGSPDTTAQASFDLIGLRATNGISAALTPGQSVTGVLTVQNLSAIALHDVKATLPGLPPGLSLTFDGPATLAGDGTLAIGYTLSAATDMGALNGNAQIGISSAEGAGSYAGFSVSVNPLVPQLVTNPGYLSTGMLRGTQKSISFDVVNTGGAATGALQVQLPADTPWLSLSSASTIANLAPGESATVTLLLAPGADLPLQIYAGSLNIVGRTSYVTVPFQFRAVSDHTGDVAVTVTDEYTYFAADKPNLAGATVQLLDVYSGAVVASQVTDASGVIAFAGVAEGAYTLQVSAPSHDSFRTTVQVTPGGLSTEEAFLHRQAVSYTWTVVPTEVQDHYKIVLESTFETEVPMPVVTVDDPFIMPLVIPGQETQFNITLRNHGLVDATQVRLNVPQDDPNYIITPLIDEIAVLAAKSEVTIPCTIRLRDNAPNLQAAAANALNPAGVKDAIATCLGIDAIYTYICLNNVWQKVSIQLVPVDACKDALQSAGGSIKDYLLEKGAGNLLTAGCDVISAALQCAGVELSPCENALLTTACAAGVGALEGGPIGALGGAAGNWADILACLCTLGGGTSSGGGGGGGGGGGSWGWGGYAGGPGAPYSVPVNYNTSQLGCSTPAPASTDTVLGTQASAGVCAQVRLRIEQQAVITRTAFQGTLELNNGRADTALTDVSMTLDIRDANGNDANDKFVLRGPTTQDVTQDANGHWTVPASTIGKIFYTFVPTNDAAPDAPTVYSIGGTLHYNDGSSAVNVPLLPARITVYPEAKLNLNYFWQRDIVGDDPFTDPVEPSEAFALGLQVTNIGKGGAGDLTITSAQPEIVENEKGLLVSYKIIGSQVGDKPGTGSLTVDLGNIAPGQTATAQWNLLSSLQGKFKDFTATFEHLDDNGDLRTSLINQVNIHELTRAVYLTSPSSDNIPDYLVNDVPDEGNLPDTLYLSTGGQSAVTVASDVAVSGAGTSRSVTATVQAGWTYVVVPDPLPGYELRSVVRSDGKVLAVGGTVWRTDRTWLADRPGATLENLVKLIDLDSTGSYTFTYAVVDHVPPSLLSISGLSAGVQTSAVDSLDLTFSEPIDPASFAAADLHLQRDGTDLALPDGISLAWVSGNTWRVSGLAAATASDGNYRLRVDASGITDLAGNAGSNSLSQDWAMGAAAPVVLSLGVPSPALRNTPVASLDLVFSRDMAAGSIDWTDLQLSRDGAPVALNAAVTVSAVTARQFAISGLDGFSADAGAYTLTVRGAGTQDSNGVAGTGQLSSNWTLDLAAPQPVAIEQLNDPVRNIVVMSLDVTLSEAINPASFDWHDITLTKDGSTTNLITSEVTVTQLNPTTWRIEGFNWKVGQDGVYTLSVNGVGLRDLAGNAGSGLVSESWTMDKTGPQAPSQLALVPDTGVSSTDGLTNTSALTVTGELGETGARLRVTDMTTGTELGLAAVSGTHFSSSFTLGSPGSHHIRLRAADSASNIADAFIDVFIDAVAPGVSSVSSASPITRTAPVDSIDVVFDEALDVGTVDLADFSLTLDGADVALTGASLVQLDARSWRLAGLNSLTAAAGSYALTVSAVGVKDLAGNSGLGAKSSSWTTLVQLPTAISGRVYEDLDGSGTYNPAHYNVELGLAGRTVYLDANGNGSLDDGETAVTTDADGNYTFSGLAAGSYQVREALPAGWLLTGPSSGRYDVSLQDGHTASGADFGDFLAAQVSGVVFNDLNDNGTLDAGEAALSGWTVFLDANANDVLDAGEQGQVTGADGGFSFANLGPATVQVAQLLPAGWHRSTPAVPYDLKSGMVVSANLGNVQLGSISGLKFNDFNGNGVRDSGEAGVAGWTIFLDANTNGVLDVGERSTVTDADGSFRFDFLLPGGYTVAEAQRDGWVQTKPLPNTVAVGVTTASSSINLEADCACGGTWATYTGPAVVDYGKLAMDTALQSTSITALRQQAGFASLDGRGTTTVVIDTGIDLNHPFFGADLNADGVDDRIVYQWDFANNDADASDFNGHGSNVSSIIGSQDGSYYGVAPGTNLIVLKVFTDSGVGTFGYLEKALQWVLANRDAYHIDVVNMSLGDNGNWTDSFSRYGIGDELAALAQTDTIMVAAAGNNYLQFGKMGVAYPGSDPAVIAVGATWAANFGGPWTVSTGATNYTTGADEIAAFSQRSTDLLDTFAPGARFNGANANGGITTMQGTSQAAAFVSGAAALAQQIAHQTLGRSLSTGEFAQLLRSTGDLILDGDDEVDNVVNTGEKFPRLDMSKLAAAITKLGSTTIADGGGITPGNPGTPLSLQGASGVYNVNLAAGAQVVGREFGNFQLGQIGGAIYADSDRSGSRDPGESGLAGLSVYLDANGNGSLDNNEASTTTASDGSFAFAALGPGAFTLRVQAPAGFELTGAGSLGVTVTSGLNAQGLTLGVARSNHQPTPVDDAYSVHAGQALAIDAARGLLANDSDADGDTLTVTAIDQSSTMGTVLGLADGSFSFTPTAGFVGDTGFSYTVTDSVGATARATVTLHVTDAAPTLDPVADQVVAEGRLLTLDLHAQDADDSELRFTLLQGPSGATLDPVTGHLNWIASDLTPQSVTVQVADPSGLTATQQFSLNVQLGRLVVTAFEGTDWGFAVRFNDVVSTTAFNLYGAALPDVTVTGAVSGKVRGSVVMDDDGKGFSFIRSGAQLVADRYTVVIRGAGDGVSNARRGALDGDLNGVAGGDWSTTMTLAAAPAVRLRLPDFARGPGQAADVPNTGSGIPVTLSSDGTVRSISLRLRTDTDTLNVTQIRSGVDLPAAAHLTVTAVTGSPGQFDIAIDSLTPLPVGTLKLLSIIATVPGAAHIGDSGAVVIEAVRINGEAAPLAADAAVGLVAYAGDIDFDAAYTANDATLVSRIAADALTSVAQLPLTDLKILADVDANGVVNATDALQVLLRSRASATPVIAAIPANAGNAQQPDPLKPLAAAAILPASSSASTALASASAGAQVNLSGSFSNFSLVPAASTAALPDAGLRILPSVTSSGVVV